MPKIRPIRDLRDTNKISELCHESEEPIFITKNGYGDLVVMSIETYEKEMALVNLYKRLEVADKELKASDGFLPAEKVFKDLHDKYDKK